MYWCIFDVDILFTNNTPNINFWTWCLLNDLVYPDPEDPDKFKHKLYHCDLNLSLNDELNQRACAMMDKLNIYVFFKRDKEGYIVEDEEEDDD